MRNQSLTERALIAIGLGGASVILATDGKWISCDVDNISSSAEDIGLDQLPKEPGVYLWTGKGKLIGSDYEPAVVYTGTVRRINSEELDDLLKMSPPGEDT